ncbi:MAG: cation:proton antiporter, partial [Thermoplasmatota archaeon]
AGLAIGLGLLIGKGTHLMKITGVVGYILTGVLLGPDVLGILDFTATEIETATNFALGFVAFIIGGQLTLSLLKKEGKPVMAIILGESLGAFLIVLAGVYLLTRRLDEALLFAALAPASAPAGAVAVIHEYKARGKLTDAILTVVGFDDGLAIFIYAFAIAIAALIISSGAFSVSTVLVTPLVEIFGGIALGAAIGGVCAFLFRRLHDREDIIAASLTAILVTAGAATMLEVSLILACLALGMTVINLFPKDNQPVFSHVQSVSLPVYIVFFVIAGVKLHLDLLTTIGAVGVIYVVCRIAGKMIGSYLSAQASQADAKIRDNIGFAILSQAGVAIGLSLLASHRLTAIGEEELGTLIVTTIAATTVVFEIIGPLAARFALHRAGEIGKQQD